MTTKDNSVTENVIFEVADALNEDPAEMEPLCEVIDPEALNKLVESASAAVSFEYEGCYVEVSGINDIDLTPL